MTWQPIETAPKDGTEMLLCLGPHRTIISEIWFGHWYEGIGLDNSCWMTRCGCDLFGDDAPTHWMPLPEPPL